MKTVPEPTPQPGESVLTSEQSSRLQKAGYSLIGASKHSAAKVCLWCKKALRGEGHCYKQEFYGIKSHRCLQFTPSLPFCTHQCVFCWRDTSITIPKWQGPIDEPAGLIDEAIAAQRKALTGFKGNSNADRALWEEAQTPLHAAISLAGEPTLYPRLAELIKEFHARNMTTFLVTNGLNPEMLRALENENALPTQLYVSLASHSPQNYLNVHKPLVEKGWEKFNESLELLCGLGKKTRTVLRMTLAKGVNFDSAQDYAKLIAKSQSDYVEVKAYMALGSSRERLGVAAMPAHDEIKKFAQALAEETGYLFAAEHAPSRVVLLCRGKKTAAKRLLF
ncbi:MAG: 4-demethylwyosine synthase TYW1 [Candidatus Micrarchaeia archaeon]|jgi:tRNA wybutosine-synthesizing protein 1